MKKSGLSLKATLLAFTALCAPSTAHAYEFSQYIGFGDSTLDSGYFRYHTTGPGGLNGLITDADIELAISQGATGAFVGTGVMNSIQLAGMFGLTAEPSSNGGTNYAIGGAETTVTDGQVLATIYQIENYLTSVNGVANPNALYVIATGSNDLASANATTAGWLDQQAATLAGEVAKLQAAGARTILVTNPYNSGIFAGLGGEILSSNAEVYARSQYYGSKIWAELTAAGVNFIPVDEDKVFAYVVKNPTLFGFTAQSVLVANAPCYATSALVCTQTAEQNQTGLWVDGKHMTTAGQQIVADLEYSLITAPSQISLINESAVQGGLARASTIQAQMDLSDQQRGPTGLNSWISAGASTLRVKNDPGFPNDPGTPFRGTVGIDYQLPAGFVVGVAFTGGAQNQTFSTGGSYDQVDEAPSVYISYKTGPVWLNAIGTYGMFQDHINREVKLGIYRDQNNADTTGDSLALALRAGGDVKVGDVTTGPVMGAVFQHIRLDGFTETGTTGVTALSFADQTRDSAVSQFGWRGAMELGSWRPFAEASWNHEWNEKSEGVSASITTTYAAPYTTEAAPRASDWATASMGTSYKINDRMMARASLSSVFANSQIVTFGGEAGLSYSF